MAKKKSWFTLVKRFFTSDSSQSHQEKKEKRKRWVFARLRMKRIPSLTAPPPQDIVKEKDKSIEEETMRAQNVSESQTEEKQRNRAISVAIASAVAAEAAVDAAHAAAEVVFLTCKPRSAHVAAETGKDGDTLDSAAVKIQTAFRGYLARKALRALKGIVTLQAIIRGRAVRRQAVTTLKRLQSIVNIQSQLCAYSFQCHANDHNADDDELSAFRDKLLRMESYSERRWDDSLMSKEEAHASLMSKKEASIKRQRIRQYWHQHRKSAESERNEISGRWRYWLEQWVDTQLTKSKDDLQDLHSKQHLKEDLHSKQPLKEDLHSKQQLNTKPHAIMYHRRQCSGGDDTSFPGSPATITNFPTYMAATESARARARSASSPKLRAESLDGFSPSKNRLSVLDQRSPSLKGIRGPVKCSGRKVNDLSFDSECSLSHWNQQQQYTFRP